MKLFLTIFLFFTSSLVFANDFKPLQKGKIKFDTYYTYDWSRLSSGIYKDSPIIGKGILSLPKNLKNDDKAPLVLILHTSGGIKPNREKNYAKFLSKNGYATFVVDTYGSRKCNASGDGWKICLNKIMMLDFATDAYMSLNTLSDHPNIDIEKTALVGFSYGADAAMLSLDQEIKKIFSPNLKSFSSVISVYGACNNIFNMSKTNGSNFYYIVGSKDISYDKEYCKERYSELKNAGSISKEYVIDNAVHAYDSDFPVQNIPTSEVPDFFKCKFEFKKDGSVTENITGVKVKFKSNDDLKTKYKITEKFTFKDIKGCFGNRSLQMGSQGFAVKKTKELLLDIIQQNFNSPS